MAPATTTTSADFCQARKQSCVESQRRRQHCRHHRRRRRWRHKKSRATFKTNCLTFSKLEERQKRGLTKQQTFVILLLQAQENSFGMLKINLLMGRMFFVCPIIQKKEIHFGNVIRQNLLLIQSRPIQNLQLITPTLLPYLFIQNGLEWNIR